MRIEVGCDHRGFSLKEQIIEWLKSRGDDAVDHGCESTDACDYPDHAFAVGRAVASHPGTLGVLICSNGIGMSMCANKVPGIRAALCVTPAMASQSRRHNDANVLVLGGEITSPEENLRVLETWLGASFEGGRHVGRVEKMKLGECCK